MVLPLYESICKARKLPDDEQVLCGRIALLLPAEQDLVRAILIHRQTYEAVGRLTGLGPNAVRGRYSRILRRMSSKGFLQAARALPYLAGDSADLAKAFFCQAQTYRQLCQRLNLSYHALRKRLERARVEIQVLDRIGAEGLQRAGARTAALGAGAIIPTRRRRAFRET